MRLESCIRAILGSSGATGLACLYGECRPRLDLEYPIYGAHELADEGAFTCVVVLTASFPSGFRRGRDLNPRPSLQGKLVECNEINH